MTKSADQQDKKYVSQEDLFRGEGLYELVNELRRLDEQHVKQLKNLDSRYEDMQNGRKYIMMETYDYNKDEIVIMKRKIELLKKMNKILEQAARGFTDVNAWWKRNVVST